MEQIQIAAHKVGNNWEVVLLVMGQFQRVNVHTDLDVAIFHLLDPFLQNLAPEMTRAHMTLNIVPEAPSDPTPA